MASTTPKSEPLTVQRVTRSCSGTRRGSDGKQTRCGATLTSPRSPFPSIACPQCGATSKWEDAAK